jgi:hypothetical protein
MLMETTSSLDPSIPMDTFITFAFFSPNDYVIGWH